MVGVCLEKGAILYDVRCKLIKKKLSTYATGGCVFERNKSRYEPVCYVAQGSFRAHSNTECIGYMLPFK